MKQSISIKDGFDTALAALRGGGLVAVPTETVYGLAADASNTDAVARIYAAKGRPSHNPLIVHVDGLAMAARYVEVSPLAEKLMEAFWPGPLTLVLPSRKDASLAAAVTAGLPTLAVRHPRGVMADLAGALDQPIAAPSANTSGRLSPTLADHVAKDLGDKVDVILDGGACVVGLESTIVKVVDESVVLLREGGVSIEAIEQVIGTSIAPIAETGKIESPGQLLAHYAPRKELRLNAESASVDEGWLQFGTGKNHDGPALNLSASADLEEAAHNLFAMLKALDESTATSLAVQPIPHHGIGAAINDRLRKAAEGARNG